MFDEKHFFKPPIPCRPEPSHPCHPEPPMTPCEADAKTHEEMRTIIDRLLRFEERLRCETDDFTKKITNDNVIFKDTFANSFKTFTDAVQNEINTFESQLSADYKNLLPDFKTQVDSLVNAFNSRLELYNENHGMAFADFQRLLQTEINVFEATVNTNFKTFTTSMSNSWSVFKETWETVIQERLNAQDAKVSDAEMYMRTNLGQTVATMVGDMKDSGELENFINEELEVHVKNDYYNVNPSTVLETAVEYCKLRKKAFYVPYGVTIPVDSPLDLTGIDVHVCGTLKITHNGIGIIVGDNELRTSNIYIREVLAPNYKEGDISVRIVGVKRARVTIDYAPTIQLYVNGDVEGQGSIAYSVFNILSCRKLMIYDEPNTNVAGWINENTFHVERITDELSIVGNSYQHNNNVFYKPCIEGATVTLKNCRRNKFYDVRNEGAKSITLDADTWQNVILYNYHTTIPYNRGSNFVDDGRDNVVECAVWQNNKYVPIYVVTPASVEKGMYSIADADYFTVADGKINPTSTYKNVIEDLVIPAKYVNRIRATSDTGCIRVRVALLDGDMNPITTGGKFGGESLSNPVYYYGVADSKLVVGEDGLYNPQTSAVAQTIDILNKDAEFIKITVQVAEKTTSFKYLTLLVGCNERDSAHLEHLKYALMA